MFLHNVLHNRTNLFFFYFFIYLFYLFIDTVSLTSDLLYLVRMQQQTHQQYEMKVVKTSTS